MPALCQPYHFQIKELLMEDRVSIDVEALRRLDPECEYVEALTP